MNEVIAQQETSKLRSDISCNFQRPIGNKYKKTIRHKICFDYNGISLAFTQQQFLILNLVAKGYSNSKIAMETSVRESAVKIFIYRLIKKLEIILHENIDRFYLIILAQRLKAEYDLYCLISNQS